MTRIQSYRANIGWRKYCSITSIPTFSDSWVIGTNEINEFFMFDRIKEFIDLVGAKYTTVTSRDDYCSVMMKK